MSIIIGLTIFFAGVFTGIIAIQIARDKTIYFNPEKYKHVWDNCQKYRNGDCPFDLIKRSIKT